MAGPGVAGSPMEIKVGGGKSQGRALGDEAAPAQGAPAPYLPPAPLSRRACCCPPCVDASLAVLGGELASLAQQIAALTKTLQGVAGPKRFGAAEEFALLVASIIDNGYLNGEVIRLDGGMRFPNL